MQDMRRSAAQLDPLIRSVARRLNLPAATVRTKLRRARLRLRHVPEIVCYAPSLPSLWSRKLGEEDMVDETPKSASPLDGESALAEVML